MSFFFSGLIETFAPTLAFADNDVSKDENKEGDAKPNTPDADLSKEKSQQDEPKGEPKPAQQDEKVEEKKEEEPKEEEEEPKEEEETKEEEPKEEEPKEEESSEESSEETTEESEEGGDDEDEDDEDEDEDEDEEEEGGDPLDTLREECAQHESIKPYVHHYQECVERVTKEQEEPDYEDKHYKEDCVEEFFHLQHHLNDCVAPRLFHKLK
ncbi:unnamed protein product [Wickerhamomyces anomalus]